MKAPILEIDATGVLYGAPSSALRTLFPQGTLVAGDAALLFAVLPKSTEVLMLELETLHAGEIDVYYHECSGYVEAVGVFTLCVLSQVRDECETAPAVSWHNVDGGLEAVRLACEASVAARRAEQELEAAAGGAACIR